MHKAMLVARREFLHNVRRPAFLFASFGAPILIIALLAIIMTVAIQAETDTTRVGTVGYVDLSGVLAQAIEKPEAFQPYPDEASARAALEAQEIGAYFVVPEDYLESGEVMLYSFNDAPEALEDEMDDFLVSNLGAQIANEDVLERLRSPIDLAVQTLDSGRVIPESAAPALFILPFIFVFIVMMASQLAGGYLMSGVVDEKSNRIMEILITSVTPFQLLLGKMVGLGALGLLQVVVWPVLGVIGLSLANALDMLTGIVIPTDLAIIGIVYFLLSYVLYASFAASAGAVIGSEQESRQVAGFFGFLSMVPVIFIFNFMTDPNGTIPVVLTLIPVTAPTAVMLRLGFGSVPQWQLVVSMALLVLMTLVVVWASARVFRWSLLLYGKRPTPREIWRAIRSAPRMAVTAQEIAR